MTSERKVILTAIGLFICLSVVVFFGIRIPDPRGQFTITESYVSGVLKCDDFFVVLDAEILGEEHLELREYRGTRLEFFSQRVEILESIFGSIDGITGMDDETAYLISSTADLEDYVRLRQQKDTSPEKSLYNIVPEDLAYIERYRKDGVELSISHRDNLIRYRYPVVGAVSQEDQLNAVREFAIALNIESNFAFDEPLITDTGLVLPIRIFGVPVVAASWDVLLDKNEELWVLQFQGYNSMHMGLSIQVLPGEILIQSISTILPVQGSSEIQPVIPVQDAVKALKENLGSVYIDGKYPDQHSSDIREIRLAYGAVFSDGEFILTPVWVFIDQQDLAWDYCFIVNAFTGEVYQAISEEYSAVLNPLK